MLSSPLVAHALNTSTAERMGDVLSISIPAYALAETWMQEDESGRGPFVKSFITATFTTQFLKSTTNATRPNGEPHSFPSGHATLAFQGAGFIHARYGWEEAWPAYLAATFVGISRVDSRNHYSRDVAVGALIGAGSSFLFTDQRGMKSTTLGIGRVRGETRLVVTARF